jgi:hypothetical protein
MCGRIGTGEGTTVANTLEQEIERLPTHRGGHHRRQRCATRARMLGIGHAGCQAVEAIPPE